MMATLPDNLFINFPPANGFWLLNANSGTKKCTLSQLHQSISGRCWARDDFRICHQSTLESLLCGGGVRKCCKESLASAAGHSRVKTPFQGSRQEARSGSLR